MQDSLVLGAMRLDAHRGDHANRRNALVMSRRPTAVEMRTRARVERWRVGDVNRLVVLRHKVPRACDGRAVRIDITGALT